VAWLDCFKRVEHSGQFDGHLRFGEKLEIGKTWHPLDDIWR
jgi:hypothetical protein